MFGQAVSFTATITPTIPGFGTPSGTASFYDGANLLGTVTLDGTGTATLNNITNLSVASHTINVTYSGDSKYQTSSGTLAGGLTVGQASTSTTVTASPGSRCLRPIGDVQGDGQSAAQVSPAAGRCPTNGEIVTFYDVPTVLANKIGTATLSGGVATLNFSGLSVSSHTINAVYVGDASLLTSTGTLTSSFVGSQAGSHTVLERRRRPPRSSANR